MEFKEFENPEQADYDLKVGVKNNPTAPNNTNNLLNNDDGIDLNALDDDNNFDVPPIPMFNTEDGVDLNSGDYEINEFGEIIRPQGRTR